VPFAFYVYKIAQKIIYLPGRKLEPFIDYDTPLMKLQDHLTCSRSICYYVSISFVSAHNDATWFVDVTIWQVYFVVLIEGTSFPMLTRYALSIAAVCFFWSKEALKAAFLLPSIFGRQSADHFHAQRGKGLAITRHI
jgi:hypothetical protein